MQNQVNILFLVLASAALALLVTAFVIFFLFITQKRSHDYNSTFSKIKKEYDASILNAQIEVQANTLQQISDEIHDNIGQKLISVKMNLGSIVNYGSAGPQSLVEDTNSIISEIIGELRHISKSISPRHIEDFGLADAISYQVDRINKAGNIHAELIINGTTKSFNPPIELVLFRMVQELMSNALKHSECSNINITLEFDEESIRITVKDDGKGFNKDDIEKKSRFMDGTGLHSIENKAKIINCSIAFNSGLHGTIITIIKKFTNDHH